MHIYKLSKLVVASMIPDLYMSTQKRSNILLLKNPRLLLQDITNRTYSKLVQANNISLSDKKNKKGLSSSKSEKKYKIYSKNLDILEIKKNKSRNKKKIQNSIEKIDDLHSNVSKSKALIKSVRNIKTKKSFKNEATYSESQENTLNTNKKIVLNSPLTLEELSKKLMISSADITKWLFIQGFSVTVNQILDLSVTNFVAQHYGFTIVESSLTNKSIVNSQINISHSSETSETRCPVITVFGHVDHGKTTLLDSIRETTTVDLEAGGITQSIGTYELYLSNEFKVNKLIFLDTPGHVAFSKMRTRGAEITDIAILVVAADDGLQPQTIESINHIQSRKIPFIVVINKIDKPEANVSKVKKELAQFHIVSDNSSKSIPIIEVSALKKHNLDLVIASLVQISIKQDLKLDPTGDPFGTIIESYLDKQKGPIAKVIVENGSLSLSNIIVAENTYCKVKAIINARKEKVKSITSLSLAEVWGFMSVPIVGSKFVLAENIKHAKSIIKEYSFKSNHRLLVNANLKSDYHKSNSKKVNLIVKADKQGSLEAVIDSLSNIFQEKIRINILFAELGEISRKDLELASTTNSVIIGFSVNLSSSIRKVVEHSSIIIKNFNVIYDLINYVQEYMLTFIEVEYEKETLGKAIVENIFSLNKGSVAGCSVIKGKLKKQTHIAVYRKEKKIYNGILDSLKRLKDDVNEVHAGNECGLMCYEYNTWEKKDLIECYDLKPKDKSL